MGFCVCMCMLLSVRVHGYIYTCIHVALGGGYTSTISGIIPQSSILFLFRALILLIFTYVSVWVNAAWVLQVAQKARIGGGSLGIGVRGNCKASSMGAWNPRKVLWKSITLSPPPTVFFETRSLTAWSSPSRTGWLASEPQGYLCLLASTKIRKHHYTSLCYGCCFSVGSGDWTLSLMPKHFTNWATPRPLILFISFSPSPLSLLGPLFTYRTFRIRHRSPCGQVDRKHVLNYWSFFQKLVPWVFIRRGQTCLCFQVPWFCSL